MYYNLTFYKGELKMADKKRVKMTLLLDSDTIEILKQYSSDKTGRESVSMAVRMLAKEYEQRDTTKETQ